MRLKVVNAIPLLIMVVALILGVPIAFSLIGAGIFGVLIITGDLNLVGILRTTPFNAVADYALTTVPMFILMAFFSSSSGLARDLYSAAANWFSHIRGGLAIATVFACGIFGAMSGASIAAASVMATIAMPHMRRFGYSESLAAGTISVGATLDILIPPSCGMVIYGIATETAINKLLIAGVIPGIILGIMLTLCILIWVTVRPSHAPKAQRVPLRECLRSLRPVWPSVLLIVVMLGLLYTGIVTPSEVGAIGACLSAVIGIVMRRLTWAGALEAFKATISTSAMIAMILIGAKILATT